MTMEIDEFKNSVLDQIKEVHAGLSANTDQDKEDVEEAKDKLKRLTMKINKVDEKHEQVTNSI